MRSSDATSLPANRHATALVLWLLATLCCLVLLFYLWRESPYAVTGAYAVPGILVVALLLAVQIARAGGATVSAGVLLPGLLFIVGGAAFDMAATVVHSPDLSQEENPIARTLLGGGHRVSFVYGYALICQSLYVSLVGVLWAGLLRHRWHIVDSVRGSRTFLELVKAATGGSGLTWRQWCLPLRLSELPRAYHVLWMIAVVLLAGSADRWYLGLEWNGVLPGVRLWVGTIAVVVGLAMYFVWLWRAIPAAVGDEHGPAGSSASYSEIDEGQEAAGL